MSVIVFNTEDNHMYADAITSVGNASGYNVPKVIHHNFDGGWRVLIGTIGTPAVYLPYHQYIIELLNLYAQDPTIDISMLDGRHYLPVDHKLTERYGESLNMFINHVGQDDPAFAALIAITDGQQVKLGVMHSTLGIQWGVEPLGNRRDVVLGSPNVTAAYNAATTRLGRDKSVVESLQSIANVQFIGVSENMIYKYTFDGDSTRVM